jgi:cardiolipin synthase A/B
MRRRAQIAIGLGGVGLAAGAVASLRRDGTAGIEYTLAEGLDVSSPDFLRAMEALTGAPVSLGNDLEVLINGDRIFPAFLKTIAEATRTLNLLTFVYWRGDIAVEVADALIERSKAGVRCNVLLDAFGAARMDDRLIEAMQAAGVQVERFRPIGLLTLGRADHRTHRKILVADGRVGMTGGVGIASEWTGDAQSPDHWRDTHVRVRGPVVRALQGAFIENWLEATGELLCGPDYLPELPAVDDGAPMQLVVSNAGVGHTATEAMYYLAIASSRTSVKLTTAYFAPRASFVHALAEAARRGVDVQIVVPGPYMDKPIVREAGRGVYQALIDAGVRIYEYQPTMLHVKALVVDGCWCSVGSANFDNRSFSLNDEATLCVQSSQVARILEEAFADDVNRSKLITDRERRGARPLSRLAEMGAALVRREL